MSYSLIGQLLGYVATGLVASAGTIAVFLWTSIGDRWLANHFNKALETHKSGLEREIEHLKARLQHFTDRRVRANQLEYEALTAAWTQYVKAHNSTLQCVARISERPDLDRLSDVELDRWLSVTEFSDQQKEQVRSAQNKNDIYGRIERQRAINIAGNEIYNTHAILGDKGIFIPQDLEGEFLTALDQCAKGWAAEKTSFSMPPNAYDQNLSKMIIEFMEKEKAIKNNLKQKIRSRILAAYPE